MPAGTHFQPEELALMKRAFDTACQERPLAAHTEAQRLILAKAIVVVYNPILSEAELVAAAWLLIK